MKSLHHLVHEELVDQKPHPGRCKVPGAEHGSPRTSGAGTVISGAAMAVCNYGLYSIAMIVLARHVYSVRTFGDFTAAVAAITVGATAGTLGLEKYLLKAVPSYRAQGEMALLRGFRRFAPGTSFLVSILVAGVLLAIYGLSQPESALHHRSFLIGICFLPIVVLGSYYLEVATADGAFLSGTFIYRILFPASFLGGIFIIDRLHSPIVADHAVILWGVCWLIVLVFMLIVVHRSIPDDERRGTRMFTRIDWVQHSTAYLSYSLLLSLMANTGILVLGFVAADKQQTAVYSAVAQLGALFVVISTAVNRWYGPQIAAIISTHDADRAQLLITSRRRIMWGIAVLYVLAVIFLGKPALALFGPEYPSGYTALLVIAAGTVVTSVNSIAPIYIQYIGKEWTVPCMLGGGVLLTILVTIPLAAEWGVLGASIGYAASGAILFIAFNVLARRMRRRVLQSIGRQDISPLI